MNLSIEKERITAVSNGQLPMGFISFIPVRPGLVNITQVHIAPAFRGQGVEEILMETLLKHLSQQNQKAALSCPFAQEYVSSHPEWKHILPGKLHFTSY